MVQRKKGKDVKKSVKVHVSWCNPLSNYSDFYASGRKYRVHMEVWHWKVYTATATVRSLATLEKVTGKAAKAAIRRAIKAAKAKGYEIGGLPC